MGNMHYISYEIELYKTSLNHINNFEWQQY